MKTETIDLAGQAPSKRDLAKATMIALAVAGLLLVTAVLPAEYNIDPLGVGTVLGLTKLAAPPPLPEELAPPTEAAALTPLQEGPVSHYPGEFRFDRIELTLGPYEFLEYKYRLEKGASMQYSWSANVNLLHDLHGEEDGSKPDTPQSFDKQPRRQGNGTLIAPFPGIHGWYWENPGGETVTIKLTTAGFYASALEIHSDRSRKSRAVTALADVTLTRKEEAATPAP